MFDVVFSVLEDVPENILAQVNVLLCAGGQELARKDSQWGAPHKQPSVGDRLPEVYSLVTIPIADLGKIDKIVVEIEEIIRK